MSYLPLSLVFSFNLFSYFCLIDEAHNIFWSVKNDADLSQYFHSFKSVFFKKKILLPISFI